MGNGSTLTKIDFSRKSIKDGIVEDAVSFILHKGNLTTVSWENVDCVLSKDETVILPQITRRVSSKILRKKHRDFHLEVADEYLKRTSFYAVY